MANHTSITGSTEPGARKVTEGIEKRRKAKMKKKMKKKMKDTGGKTTARSPSGVQKTKEQGMKEMEALRKKIAKRIEAAKKKAEAAKKK